MDEEIENEICTPIEVDQMAYNATTNQLTEKSKRLYMNTYKDFLDWCNGKNIKNYSENAFIAYFSEKSNIFKASTLWSQYSMLKSIFNINNNIDISKYTKLTGFLKRTSKNYKPKKTKTFTAKEIEKFIKEAPDDRYLMMKVVAIFGISGACRRQELYDILTDDVHDVGTALFITIRESANKSKNPRTFTIPDDKNKFPSYMQIYRRYASLRPPITNHKQFFIFYRNDKCSKQPVGLNQFGKFPSLIAKFLNLPHPDTYTGHCFRRSSADIATAKRHESKSSPATETYLEDPLLIKEEITEVYLKEEDNDDEEETSEIYIKQECDQEEVQPLITETHNHKLELEVQPSISDTQIITRDVLIHEEKDNHLNITINNIKNCQNITININVKKI